MHLESQSNEAVPQMLCGSAHPLHAPPTIAAHMRAAVHFVVIVGIVVAAGAHCFVNGAAVRLYIDSLSVLQQLKATPNAYSRRQCVAVRAVSVQHCSSTGRLERRLVGTRAHICRGAPPAHPDRVACTG